MADKDFGVKRINLVGAAGTPTITSPTDLIINANKVAISTNVTVGGSLGIGTTNLTSKLWVGGDGFFAGVITATKFSGTLDATSAATQRVGFATTATNLANGAQGSLPYQNSSGITSFLDATTTPDQVLVYDTGTNKPKWANVVGTGGAINGITVRDEGTNTLNTITTLDIFGSNIIATSGGTGIASIRVSDNLVGTALSISGISTFGNSTTGIKIDGTTGIITSNTGTAVTFFGNLTGTASTAGLAQTAFSLQGFTPSTGSVGFATTARDVTGGIGSLSDLKVTGISTFGTGTVGVVIKTENGVGVITALNPGVGTVTYYGDGSKLTGLIGGVSISTITTNQAQFITYATGTGSTTGFGITTGLVFNPFSGNLGIGTTTPTSKLWVNGDGRFTGIVTVGTGFTGIVINGITGIITSSNPGVTTITYYGDGSKLTGIGTAASATNVVLNDDSSSTITNIVFSQTPSQNPTSSLKTNSTLVFNASTSSLGIGTTVPKSKLTVQGDLFVSGFSTFKGGLEVTDLLVLKPGQQSSNLFEILNDTQDVVVAVNTSGNLGIGTTNLTSKLWVGGDGFFAGVVTATKFFGAIDATFASAQSVGFATTARNVIGGIASVTSLTVSGNSILSGFATFSSGLEVTDLLVLKPGQQGLNLFEILNDAQDVVVAVTTSGNLGIGTTTPNQKLWVDGNGYFTGILTAKEFYGDGSKLSNIISGVAITSSSASTPQFIGFLTATSGTTASILSSSTLTYIPSSGNLGVGASAPAFKLDIAGDARVQSTGKMRFGGTAGSSNFYIQYNSTTNSLDFVAG
jgi:hypothetical protein